VDLSWYGGVHPFGYSVLAPWVMAVLGVTVAGLLAAVAGAVLLARLLRDSERPVLAGVAGAVFSVADVASGRTTFALAAVAALGALLVLPRLRLAAVLAVLTALLSPVAAAFLGFAAAVLVLHRRPGGWTLGIASTVPVLATVALFPGGGVQPFSTRSGVLAIVAAALLFTVTSVPMVRTGALLYIAAILLLLNHSDPFGSNILRLGLLLAAALVLATSRWPLVLVLAVTSYCLWWQAGPTIGDLQDTPSVSYASVTHQLERLGSRRAEVIATRDHRESWAVAARIPLARGWARQIDEVRNPLFYDGSLEATSYRAWLLDHAVDAVAVPQHATLDFGSTAEATLVLAGAVEGLEEVWQDKDWRLYKVLGARPIASAPAVVVSSTREALVLRTDAPAEVTLELQWSRWLTVDGDGCLVHDGSTVRLRLRRPGQVTVTSSFRPAPTC
jgi:hypothetical protein